MVYLDDIDLDLNLDLRKPKSKSFVWVKLKEMDLNLAKIHLGFQGSKSKDLKSPHKPKNLEIPRTAHTLVLSSKFFIRSRNSVTQTHALTFPRPRFYSFSLSRNKVCLSQLFSSSLSFHFSLSTKFES